MFSIIDQNIGPYPSECIKKFMTLALKCSQDSTKDRPTMLEVVRELENISSMLPESGNSPLESDISASSLNSGRNTSVTQFPGSDLVSGVIPTIRPR